jgi:flagellin-specific chaperone FliS
MRDATAYLNTQTITLSHEQAFAELYLRLARWTSEIASGGRPLTWDYTSGRLDRAIALLGYMSGVIDVSHNYDIAANILSLHRFAIGALVRAKTERDPSQLDGLSEVFVTLSETLRLIGEQTGPAASAA